MTDLELLNQYVRERSEEAFASLVGRYVRLVHSACWRQLKDVHRAEDATQMVFELLSRKAGKLRHAKLGGWLVTAAHYTCANIKRGEDRRARREQGMAMPQSASASSASAEESELLGLLDAGLMKLREADREALVLRYLQEQPLGAVGQALGLSEDAARKRVERGLEKLRRYLSSRGVTTETAALAVVMADHSHVPAMPASLAPRIVQACRVQVPTPGGGRGPKGMIAASLALAVGAVITGWGIFGSYTSATQPTVLAEPAPTAAPEQPAVAPTPVPTAAVAMDLSTPDNTLGTLCRALLAPDESAVYACLMDGPHQPPTTLDASLQEGLAERR